MIDYEKMSDRELDAMVHTRVMGKEPEIVWIARADDDKPDDLSGACVFTSKAFESPFRTRKQIEDWIVEHPKWCGERMKLGKWEQFPEYTTDPSAWWDVVLKMGQNGWTSTREWKGCGRGYEFSSEVYMRKTGSLVLNSHATHESEGRAICIAALRALDAQAGGK